MRFAVFLRAVNVGTTNRMRMDALRDALRSAGATGVATYLQSGNVLLEVSDSDDPARVVSAGLRTLGIVAEFCVRSETSMAAIVAAAPFGNDGSDDSHRFVTFLSAQPATTLPSKSANGDWEVLRHNSGEIYTVARLVGGRYGAPNATFEKLTGGHATTRNWAVVQAVERLLRESDLG